MSTFIRTLRNRTLSDLKSPTYTSIITAITSKQPRRHSSTSPPKPLSLATNAQFKASLLRIQAMMGHAYSPKVKDHDDSTFLAAMHGIEKHITDWSVWYNTLCHEKDAHSQAATKLRGLLEQLYRSREDANAQQAWAKAVKDVEAEMEKGKRAGERLTEGMEVDVKKEN